MPRSHRPTTEMPRDRVSYPAACAMIGR